MKLSFWSFVRCPRREKAQVRCGFRRRLRKETFDNVQFHTTSRRMPYSLVRLDQAWIPFGQPQPPQPSRIFEFGTRHVRSSRCSDIHPASRGVAAHTAGLFRSVRGAKGGFPPWGLPKLRIFTFPPVGAPQAREFSLFPPVGAPQAREFSLPPVGAPQAREFSLFPPVGAPQAREFSLSPPWGLPKLGSLFPPVGAPQAREFSLFPPWGLPKLGNFHFSPPWGLPKLGNFHFSPPWGLPKLWNFHFSLPWRLSKLRNFK